MPHKDLATVRVSNLPPNWQREELLHLFESCKATESFKISLCASTAAEGAHSTATVTFNSGSEAKQALSLNGKVLRAYNISIDRDFMGLTVLAAPENSSVEYVERITIFIDHDITRVNLSLALLLFMVSTATLLVLGLIVTTIDRARSSCGSGISCRIRPKRRA